MNKEEERTQLEKSQKRLTYLRFLGFPLGWIMYYLTVRSFGETIALILCVIATLAFWFIVTQGRDKEYYDRIAGEINEAINDVGKIEHLIEMKMLATGMVIRVYLINPGERIEIYTKAIYRALLNWNITSKSWAVQVATAPSKEQIDKVRTSLDEELIQDLRKKKNEE